VTAGQSAFIPHAAAAAYILCCTQLEKFCKQLEKSCRQLVSSWICTIEQISGTKIKKSGVFSSFSKFFWDFLQEKSEKFSKIFSACGGEPEMYEFNTRLMSGTEIQIGTYFIPISTFQYNFSPGWLQNPCQWRVWLSLQSETEY
jgi:hypothetical protein